MSQKNQKNENEEVEVFNERFDLRTLRQWDGKPRLQTEAFLGFYNECVEKRISPFLSDLIVEGDSWGCRPLVVIAENELERASVGGELLKFTLHCLCDQWGKKLKPGDFVTHFVPTKAWKSASPKEETRAKQIGEYDRLYKKALQFKVDEKGCIKVPFQTASYFLQQYGIHSFTKNPVTKKQELSMGTVVVKKGSDQKAYVHYWRFEELTREQYAALPAIGAQA